MEALRKLPKVDELLKDKEIIDLIDIYSREIVLMNIRASIDELRKRILEGEVFSSSFSFHGEIIEEIKIKISAQFDKRLKRVINGTGVVIHTNLGRSLICDEGVKAIIEVAESYSNLEFDLKSGKRGSRYDSVKEYLKILTGAEEVVVVNNNAAAVLLVLSSLCKGKECIISRGELVEIGGSFRIPDIMELSGSRLREVGTTNRTHLRDYEKVINENTGGVLKVHTSNYKIMGFTKEVSISDLKSLCEKSGIPLIEDLGSGLITKLNINGIDEEQTVKEKILKGVDVITFSGDKLLGGPQCGIIVGKKELIEKIKKNQLNRALRIDKFTLAALEGTLKEYVLNREENIPTLNMLRKPVKKIQQEIKGIEKRLENLNDQLIINTGQEKTYVGGGSLPMAELDTYVLYITHKTYGAEKIEKYLRNYETPIITRINKGKVIIDGRTLIKEDGEIIIRALSNLGGTI